MKSGHLRQREQTLLVRDLTAYLQRRMELLRTGKAGPLGVFTAETYRRIDEMLGRIDPTANGLGRIRVLRAALGEMVADALLEASPITDEALAELLP